MSRRTEPHPRQSRYHGLPSVTDRAWGQRPGDEDAFGTPGELGGWGDFREPAPRRDARPSQRGRGPRDAFRPDDRIYDELNQRLADDPEIDAHEILVAVEDATVILTGEVPSRRMKYLAEEVASRVRGVREIHNHLTVDRGDRAGGPPGRAVRSGHDQQGSGFSSSAFDQRDDLDDALRDAQRRGRPRPREG